MGSDSLEGEKAIIGGFPFFPVKDSFVEEYDSVFFIQVFKDFSNESRAEIILVAIKTSKEPCEEKYTEIQN